MDDEKNEEISFDLEGLTVEPSGIISDVREEETKKEEEKSDADGKVEEAEKDFSVNLSDSFEIWSARPRPRTAKERYLLGFHNDLNRFLDEASEWEFGAVVDLGDVVGVCQRPNCNHPIRYEYWIQNKKAQNRMALGSTCITQVDFVANHLNLSEEQFLGLLRKQEQRFKNEFRREENLVRYADIYQYMRRVREFRFDFFTSQVIRLIERGETLSDDILKNVYDMMKSGYVERLEYEEARAGEEKKKKVVQEEIQRKEEQLRNQELMDILDRMSELSAYLTSPFVAKMVKIYEKMNWRERSISSVYSSSQIDSMKKIIAETNIKELEEIGIKTAAEREGQAGRVSAIIEGMESGAIWKGDKASYRATNGEEPLDNWYEVMFRNFLERTDKRPLTDRELATLDKCEHRYSAFLKQMRTKKIEETKAREGERARFDEVSKEAEIGANNLSDKEKEIHNAGFLDVLDKL